MRFSLVRFLYIGGTLLAGVGGYALAQTMGACFVPANCTANTGCVGTAPNGCNYTAGGTSTTCILIPLPIPPATLPTPTPTCNIPPGAPTLNCTGVMPGGTRCFATVGVCNGTCPPSN
jgi:hypothetical protein